MKTTRITAVMAASLLGATLPSSAQFQNLWTLGIDNDNQSEFAQERGTNAPPGSATLKDDDYYFAGVYPDPIGIVAEDENQKDPTNNTGAGLTGFERAVTFWDPNCRIHFNLDEIEVGADFSINIDLRGGGSANGGGYGTHNLDVSMNGNLLTSTIVDGVDQLLSYEFSGTEGGAVGGENIIEIIRTGGTENAWIQFDYITLDIDRSALGCTEPICSFTGTQSTIAPGDSLELNWFTDPTATLSIDQGVGVVAAGAGTVTVSPTTNTTYTLSSTVGGETTTAEVSVEVNLLNDFTSDVGEVTPEAPNAVLSWDVDPAAGVTVSIDQGIGDVTASTVNGVGSVQVSPTETTTYTITVTRPNSPSDDVVTLSVDVEYNDFDLLWIVGNDDGGQTEFSQENGNSNDVATGSPSALDDDYFFAGDYGGTIGVVPADEEWLNFERAVTHVDNVSRLHFLLTAVQAAEDSRFRLTVDLERGGWGGGGFGIHDIVVNVNGTEVFSEIGIVNENRVRVFFTGEDVAMEEGENIVEVVRTGGDSGGDGGNVGWIQFDYVQMDIIEGTLEEFAVSDISLNSTVGIVLITFPSKTGQTFKIESSPNLQNWSEEDDAYAAEEGEDQTTFVYSPPGGNLPEEIFFQVTRN